MPSIPSPPRSPDPDNPDLREPAGGSLLMRAGTAIGAAVGAAAIAVVPAVLRVGRGATSGPSAAQAWPSLAAIALIAMVIAIPLLRQARVGLRAFAGPSASSRMLGFALWLFLLFAMLVPFGAVLRATTHQHALAGVTYALLATGLAVGLAIVCARFSSIVAARSDRTRRIVIVVMSVALLGCALLLGLRLSRALTGAAAIPAAASAMCVDTLALAIAALFASRGTFEGKRILAILGPPAAAILLFVGLSTLRSSSVLTGALAEHAPAYSAIATLVVAH